MLAIDLTGKRALIAGVSDDGGFGFAIAKALAEAGASICVGSWPPALGIFTKLLRFTDYKRMTPFNELAQTSYDELEQAVMKATGRADTPR